MNLQLLTACLLLGLASSFQTTYLPSHAEILSISPTILYQSSSDESSPASNRISIEYCTGCRWMLKAFWTAQELLTTFEDDLDAVTVVPSASKGIYAVVLNDDKLLWDRKERGGFPSPKSLKQIVRDLVEPEKFLGHSDSEERQQSYSEDKEETETDMISREDLQSSFTIEESEALSPSVAITYCTGCKWLLRAAYFGQELLTTFGEEIKSVSLVPSKPPSKGGGFVCFNILCDRYSSLDIPHHILCL
jgi:selenoprotein W-related protein